MSSVNLHPDKRRVAVSVPVWNDGLPSMSNITALRSYLAGKTLMGYSVYTVYYTATGTVKPGMVNLVVYLDSPPTTV
jgi:hypothetical protein